MIYYTIGLTIIGVAALLALHAIGLLRQKKTLFASTALISAALVLRAFLMEHETLDYQIFLTQWVTFFRENGGIEGLSQSIGNYNLPYLYFLSIFSYSSIRDLYLIKLLSVFFDFVLAFGVAHIVCVFHKSRLRTLAAFFLTLFLPTVVLNGAYWGQCDSIYAAFAVWSVYFALSKRPIFSVVCIALSFAFKLQAVFIMPVFLLFIYTGRMKWWHLTAFPVTYIATVLPAVVLGRPFVDTILLYFNQAGTVGSGLNYNSASIFALIQNVQNTSLASKLAILGAFLFVVLILVWLFTKRKNLSGETALACAVLFSIAIPFLLPHMHDRYFFVADVLTLAFAVVIPTLSFVPVCVSFASLLSYHAYLRAKFLLPLSYGASAMLVAAIFVLLYMIYHNGITSKKIKKPY